VESRAGLKTGRGTRFTIGVNGPAVHGQTSAEERQSR
jgi:hypothetical protein